VKITWSLSSSYSGDGDHSDDITANANANAAEEGKADAMRGHRDGKKLSVDGTRAEPEIGSRARR
jgi:hypothetical protein